MHPTLNPTRIILASQSPRRRELLALAGVTFEVMPMAIDETPRPGEAPDAYVLRLAREKAQAAVRLLAAGDGVLVIAADTTVTIDGAILEKPRDAAEARAMLTRLAGRRHQVCTGVALARGVRLEAFLSSSTVQFAPLDATTIEAYVATGEPMDKAGAYAVQGGAQAFIERIEGSYTGIMGLPLAETLARLRDFAHPVS
jgi:septum formation protein